MVRADLDRHLLAKALQKIEELVRGEAAEMPVHQMRHVGLRNAENAGDLALLQFLVFEDLEDVKSDLRAHHKLVGVFEAEIGEDVAGALFELNLFSLFSAHAPSYSKFTINSIPIASARFSWARSPPNRLNEDIFGAAVKEC
jgi:hypothetical protein